MVLLTFVNWTADALMEKVLQFGLSSFSGIRRQIVNILWVFNLVAQPNVHFLSGMDNTNDCLNHFVGIPFSLGLRFSDCSKTPPPLPLADRPLSSSMPTELTVSYAILVPFVCGLALEVSSIY